MERTIERLYGIQMIHFSSKMDAYGVWSVEKIWVTVQR